MERADWRTILVTL